MKYIVVLERTVIEETWVTVEADNEDDANKKAEAQAYDVDVKLDWEYRETFDEVEAVSCEVVNP